MQSPSTDTAIKHLSWKQAKVYKSYIEEIADKNPKYSQLIGGYITSATLQKKINERPKIDRQALVNHLKNQYTRFNALTQNNQSLINSLADENTFTVTSGHQICFLTGPLYLPIKIYQSINLAKEFKRLSPKHNFVPVYWMATEDHDFEEIQSTYIFNKKFAIDNINEQLKVGELSTELIQNVFNTELKDVLNRNEIGESVYNFIADALKNAKDLSHFMFNLCSALFKDEDLIILDADSKILKNAAKPIFKQELEQQGIYKSIKSFEKELTQYCDLAIDPRALNLFCFEGKNRYRLDVDGDNIIKAESKEKISIESLLENSENISPNVLSRPLYQEAILPNLAYVGGAAELGYWAELSTTFAEFNLQKPFVVLRNSVLVLGTSDLKKLDKAKLNVEDLFLEDHILTEKIAENDGHNLDQNELKSAFNQYIEKLIAYNTAVDPTLKASAKAHQAEELNYLADLKKDLKKRILQQNETTVNQLIKLKENLLPKGKLNERKNNLFEYIIKYGWDFLPQLKEASGSQSTGLSVLHTQ